MAAYDNLFNFKVRMTGQQRLALMIGTSLDAVGAVLAKNKISSMIVRQAQDRFKPPGANRNAQRSPVTGQFWAGLSESTKRKKNRNRSQRLVDKDKLRRAIYIARDKLKDATSASTGSGIVSVRRMVNKQIYADGTVKNYYTDEYGAYHQSGTGKMPAREFMGVTRKDAAEVEILMTATFNRFVANFG